MYYLILKKSKEKKTKVSKVRVELETYRHSSYNTTVTPRAGHCFPDRVTFFFELCHATRPNL